ncbi:hypothetical protein MIMGU_mgv1a0229431mg, partial [Erythranthe guttata]
GLLVIDCAYRPTKISFDNCHFGTECFQRVTKVKSRMVMQILKLGYNVFLSDVDVYWFKNPLPYLTYFGPSVLVAQSDEYNSTDNITIAIFDKVVEHATNSNFYEQPSDNQCLEPEIKLLVYFLNRDLLPNGAYRGSWEEIDTNKACIKINCFILHNNWINGRKKKLQRQVLSGLWDYDINTRMCL